MGGVAVGGVIGVPLGMLPGVDDQGYPRRRVGEAIEGGPESARVGIVAIRRRGVDEHQAHHEGREDRQARLQRRGDEHAVARPAEHLAQQVGDVGGVVHDEDRVARLHDRPPWRELLAKHG